MKQTIKVFIIIGMAISFYLIFPIVVGMIALRKLEEANSREELRGTGILTLIFCSQIAGILMLCLKDTDFDNVPTPTVNGAVTPNNQIPASQKNILPMRSLAEIEKLWALKESNILTEEEFIEKKNALLASV